MATYKDMEDSLKSFLIQEQSDAHNVRTMNVAKYNNIKISMDPSRNPIPHVVIRISISEAVYSIIDFSKMNGGLGAEERYVIKWFSRMGIKEKFMELWSKSLENVEE